MLDKVEEKQSQTPLVLIELPSTPDGTNVDLLQEERSGAAATFTRNSLLSVGRLLVSSIISLLLPSFLTHKLSLKTYSAWVLVLQMSAYVSYLDFGIQTGIAKYVSEFEARKDLHGATLRVNAGLALMMVTSFLGVVLSLILAWQIPNLFREIPPSLLSEVRYSVLFVGVSLSFGLLCSICSAIFLGLQRYTIPTVLSLTNRFLYALAVLAAVMLHQGLAAMAALVALSNVLTGLLQVGAWRRFAGHVRLSLHNLDFGILRQMLAYSSTLAIWTVGMLCVSGLDVTIVGRYDFPQTASYSIAILPTNFVISIMAAALAPLLPAASALSVRRTPQQMGDVLSRATRLASVLLIGSGLPVMVGGFWILHFWVGAAYAVHTLPFLRILILANVLRNTCMPYASMLVATDSQRIAIAGAVSEATVNLGASIYLARHYGAIGVAFGTLLGSFVSVGMHFTLNMHYTYRKFAISRAKLFLSGILRPLSMAIPSLLLVRRWWSPGPPAFTLPIWMTWALSTLLLAWFVSLDPAERTSLTRALSARTSLRKLKWNSV